MNIRLIDSWLEFRDISPEWDELLKKSSADTIFLTWDWMCSWLEIWSDYYRPYVLVVRDDNDVLVGAAPFYQGECWLLKFFKYHTLRIIGDTDSGSEYPAWIAVSDSEVEIFTCIADELVRREAEWDCIWMPRMNGWGGAHENIVHACQKSGLLVNMRPRDFSAISLPNSMAEIDVRQTKNRRQQMKRQIKKVLSSGDVSFTRCEREEDIQQYIEELFGLNHKRWSYVGMAGTFFRKPQEARFYKLFVPRALKNGWLSFYFLRSCDVVKATQIGFTYKNTFHQMQEGFDPDFLPGTGNVLRWHVIEDCIEHGVESYDFLGGVTEHKRRWGAVQRTGCDIFIGAKKIKNRFLFLAHVWPTGRYFIPKYPIITDSR